MTVRSRCPAGLLRRPVRSVKLQGTSFPEGARSPADRAHCHGGRILLSREQRRSGASPLGLAPRPSYSERNRSHTVLRGADRRHPVGGPAARAALSSPVGPSPSKSREPWLVLSLPDRSNRTRPAVRERRPGVETASARTSVRSTGMPSSAPTAARVTLRTAPRTAERTERERTERTAALPTSTGTRTPLGMPVRTSSREPLLAGRPRGASRRLGLPSRPQVATDPTVSRALCVVSPAVAASPAVTALGPANGAERPRPTLRGLR